MRLLRQMLAELRRPKLAALLALVAGTTAGLLWALVLDPRAAYPAQPAWLVTWLISVYMYVDAE